MGFTRGDIKLVLNEILKPSRCKKGFKIEVLFNKNNKILPGGVAILLSVHTRSNDCFRSHSEHLPKAEKALHVLIINMVKI